MGLRMRIAIVNITGGGISGGYHKYLLNMIPRISSHPAVETVLCAMPQSFNAQDLFEQSENVNFVTCRPFRFCSCHTDTQLHMYLEKFSPDVIFVPVERFFQFKEVPVVTMIQNMEPFVSHIHGDPLSEKLKKYIQYIAGKYAVKKTDRVIAISSFVYDFLQKYWGIPSEKISLVYHGIDVKKKDGCQPDMIPKDWRGKFMFTAGSIRPARGLEDVLLAMRHLVSRGVSTEKLVIAGEASGASMTSYRKKLKDWIRRNNLSHRVCWTGNLNENEMTWCYQNCGLFIMTSRVEACPNIALEALSHSCISTVADNPPLPEIFGDAAIYYPPRDDRVLAEAIQAAFMLDDKQRKGMSEKARRRAAQFSWDICAEETVGVLAKAVGNF